MGGRGYNWRQSCDKSTVKLSTTVAFCDMSTVEMLTVDKSTVYFSTPPQFPSIQFQIYAMSSFERESEKALQTVDTEFNTGNALWKPCKSKVVKDKCGNESRISWIYFIRWQWNQVQCTFDNAELSNKNDDLVIRCCCNFWWWNNWQNWKMLFLVVCFS